MSKRRKYGDSRDRLNKKQIAMYLEEGQLEALRTLHAKTRVPMQVYLREGLDLILQKYRKELTV